MEVSDTNAASGGSPAIAQLVERQTVDAAVICWSLVRFRVAGRVLGFLQSPLAQTLDAERMNEQTGVLHVLDSV